MVGFDYQHSLLPFLRPLLPVLVKALLFIGFVKGFFWFVKIVRRIAGGKRRLY